MSASGKPRKPQGTSARKSKSAARRGRSGNRNIAPSEPPPKQTKTPADIPTCAALLNLWAVMLGADGWFVLAAVTRSTGSPCVWRRANGKERDILDRAAGDRIVAGHWSIRPGGRQVLAEWDQPTERKGRVDRSGFLGQGQEMKQAG